jgi:hypothetical protein
LHYLTPTCFFELALASILPEVAYTMKLTVAFAVAAATHFGATRVIDVLHSPDEATVFRTDDLDTPTRLGTREVERPTVTFWDDDYASEKDWDTYTHKGGALMCGLKGSDETAGRQIKDTRTPPSAKTQLNGDLKTELQNWYWRYVKPSSFSCRLAEHWHFPNAMQSLGLDGRPASQGGDNTCYRVEHWDPEKTDGNGNTVPAINQWYNVPGIERQYHVRYLLNTALLRSDMARQPKRTTSLASTRKVELSTASSSRAPKLQPERSGLVAARTRPKKIFRNSAPSPT